MAALVVVCVCVLLKCAKPLLLLLLQGLLHTMPCETMLVLALFSALKELHSCWKHWQLAQLVSDWQHSSVKEAMQSAGIKPWRSP